MNRRAVLSSLAVVLGAGAWLSLSGNGLIAAAQAQSAEIDTSGITEMVLGDADAPVEIIEYASFTCPHCASFHTGDYKQLKADFIDTGKVRFVYREVYFDRYGLWASMLARCGGAERFFGITDLLYENQSTWSRASDPAAVADELRRIGRLAGLPEEDMEACLQDGEMAQTLVAWYQDNAQEHGIDATPSFVVNGRKVSNRSYADFKALIESELAG
jgi:protein-disulfide isomerase